MKTNASPRQMCLEFLLLLDGEQSTSQKPPKRWNETREDNINNQGERGFPGGSVVMNLPANAGDRASIPDLGRYHMPQSNQAHAPQLLKPTCSKAHALQQEKPLQ